jgi:hypothetical protein
MVDDDHMMMMVMMDNHDRVRHSGRCSEAEHSERGK